MNDKPKKAGAPKGNQNAAKPASKRITGVGRIGNLDLGPWKGRLMHLSNIRKARGEKRHSLKKLIIEALEAHFGPLDKS
ncbi:MAG: hypothetical protein AAF546_00025 [Verrucomicrobiota bacterium]